MVKKKNLCSLLYLIIIVNLCIGSLFFCFSCKNPVYFIIEVVTNNPDTTTPGSGQTPGGGDTSTPPTSTVNVTFSLKDEATNIFSGNPPISYSITSINTWDSSDIKNKKEIVTSGSTTSAITSVKWFYDGVSIKEITSEINTPLTVDLTFGAWYTSDDSIQEARVNLGPHNLSLKIEVGGKKYTGNILINITA